MSRRLTGFPCKTRDNRTKFPSNHKKRNGIADNPNKPNDPSDADEYYDTLEDNEDRTNGHVKIDVTHVSGSTYTVDIYLDNEQQKCYSENITLTDLGKLDLQSHWGGGVIFSNMDITKKEP